jgi:hypothetical protein
MALVNLKKVNNAASGFGKILVCPYADITTHPTVGAFTNPGDEKKYTTGPTFAINKGWIDLGLEVDLGKLGYNANGEWGSISKEVIVDAAINSLDEKVLAALDMITQDEVALLIKAPEGSNSNPLYVGCADKGARAIFKGTSGAVKGAGKKGADITFTYYGSLFTASFALVANTSTAY